MHDDFYQMYLDELEAIAPLSEEEAQKLAELAAAGDKAARDRLVEGELHQALALAQGYDGSGLTAGDLIQEANMALTLAAASYTEGDWKSFMESEIRNAVQAALEEQNEEHQAEEAILARVNVLKDIAQSMAEDLGREATVEELAAKMKMEPDEIKAIMKITLDALSAGTEV